MHWQDMGSSTTHSSRPFPGLLCGAAYSHPEDAQRQKWLHSIVEQAIVPRKGKHTCMITYTNAMRT